MGTSESRRSDSRKVVCKLRSYKGSCPKDWLGIIPVTVSGTSGKCCKTYALLDDVADKSLCNLQMFLTHPVDR